MSTDPIVTSVDPITFEILSHRVYQIAREMGTTLERVGGTVNTTQMHDYMAALYLADGDVLCAGDAMGWHVACAGVAVKRIIERFEKAGGIYPGRYFSPQRSLRGGDPPIGRLRGFADSFQR